jgi:hypothetical protein
MGRSETPSKTFLNLFEKELFKTTNANYYFPKDVRDDPSFEQTIKTILSQVHETVFQSKEVLDRKERRAFIELTPVFITLHYIVKTKARYLAIACKNNADRGMKMNALLFEVLSIFTNFKNEEKHKEILTTLIDGPSLFGLKRGMNEERRTRFAETLEFLNDESVRENIYNLRDVYSFNDNDKITIIEDPAYALTIDDLQPVK